MARMSTPGRLAHDQWRGRWPTTAIEDTGTLVEVSTDYAQLVDELTVEEREPASSDDNPDP